MCCSIRLDRGIGFRYWRSSAARSSARNNPRKAEAGREDAGRAAGGGGGNGAARASTAPAFFKVDWVQPQGQTGQVPIVQENVADPNVE